MYESPVRFCGGWPGAADKFAGAVGYEKALVSRVNRRIPIRMVRFWRST